MSSMADSRNHLFWWAESEPFGESYGSACGSDVIAYAHSRTGHAYEILDGYTTLFGITLMQYLLTKVHICTIKAMFV